MGSALIVEPLEAVARRMVDRLPGVQRLVNRVEVELVRRFGRSIVSVLVSTPVLVLESVGRTTGRRRVTVVAYGRFPRPGSHGAVDGGAVDGGELLVVVGGAAGKRQIPDWVANVRACPEVVVVIDGVSAATRFEELHGDRRSALWPALVGAWPRIERYEYLAGRPIPVFVLERVEPP